MENMESTTPSSHKPNDFSCYNRRIKAKMHKGKKQTIKSLSSLRKC